MRPPILASSDGPTIALKAVGLVVKSCPFSCNPRRCGGHFQTDAHLDNDHRPTGIENHATDTSCGCLKRIVVVDKTAQQRSPDLRSVLVTKLRDQDVLLLLFGRQKTFAGGGGLQPQPLRRAGVSQTARKSNREKAAHLRARHRENPSDGRAGLLSYSRRHRQRRYPTAPTANRGRVARTARTSRGE